VRRRLYEILFISLAILLVVFVGLLNCLQGTVFAGGLKCNLEYTSSDLVVKILATVIFVLFLGLIFGPIGAVVIQSIRGKPTKTTHVDK
jgi:hypothetical protein